MNYTQRIDSVARWLRAEKLEGALLVDEEGRRNPAIRYLSGHPSDALLFVLADGRTILVPWDINLARLLATAAETIPYSEFDRNVATALGAIVERERLAGTIEVGEDTPHPLYERLVQAVPRVKLLCRERGIDRAISDLRVVKDAEEIALIERAASITNEILAEIERRVRSGAALSEADIALEIEHAARSRGAEGTSFETIAAGPRRSFGIHAFPAFGSGAFATEGLSILDFGVKVDGYPSDVTLTVARGKPTPKQDEMLGLVEEAYAEATSIVAPGRGAAEIARRVDELFARSGWVMPHSLGHGVGLEIHEAPYLRDRKDNNATLAAGMVVTVEPGLYDPEAGGVRLENDFLVTESGARALTSARILRIP